MDFSDGATQKSFDVKASLDTNHWANYPDFTASLSYHSFSSKLIPFQSDQTKMSVRINSWHKPASKSPKAWSHLVSSIKTLYKESWPIVSITLFILLLQNITWLDHMTVTWHQWRCDGGREPAPCAANRSRSNAIRAAASCCALICNWKQIREIVNNMLSNIQNCVL